MRIILRIISCLMIYGFLSCEPDLDQRRMMPEVQYISDTMFSNSRKAIEVEMDSLCTVYEAARLDHLVDSLLQSELRYKEKLDE